MKNTTMEINVRGKGGALVREILSSLGVEVLSVRGTKRLGWIVYELQSTTPKYKVQPVPGYTFMSISYNAGKAGAFSKWKSIHPQTFPGLVYKPTPITKNLNTETWHDLVRAVLEAGGKAKTNKRQFDNVRDFERYCDTLGVFRIIQAERGLNK